jgi:hypothetical protein
MSTVSSCAFLVVGWRRNEVMVGVYFRTLLRANRGIHPCMLELVARQICVGGGDVVGGGLVL